MRKCFKNPKICAKICVVHKRPKEPGLASAVEERSPTNPAIQVRNRGEEFFVRDNINLQGMTSILRNSLVRHDM